MRRNIGSSRLDEEDYSVNENQTAFTCGTCGEKFHKPILATVSSSGYIQKYYACPRCIVKIRDTKAQEKEEEKATFQRGDSKKLAAVSESNFECGHFLGYLKKRSKDTPIPDECLTCNKMIECLIH